MVATRQYIYICMVYKTSGRDRHTDRQIHVHVDYTHVQTELHNPLHMQSLQQVILSPPFHFCKLKGRRQDWDVSEAHELGQ